MRVYIIIFTCLFLIGLPDVITKSRGRGSRRSSIRSRSKTSYSGTNNKGSDRHAHYSYHPPQNVNFMCKQCTAPVSYPVYQATLPAYVYKYRHSGSRYGDLLTGLALYNLGRVSSFNLPLNNYYRKQDVAEACSMQVVDNNNFEETTVPCFVISTFLEQPAVEPEGSELNQLDNSSLQLGVNDFIDATGASLVVIEQECIIWHNTTMNRKRSVIPCALLQRYAETLRPSITAEMLMYIWLFTSVAFCVVMAICCQCFCTVKRDRKEEEAPLNATKVLGYSSYVP